jgi:hypothetical protein
VSGDTPTFEAPSEITTIAPGGSLPRIRGRLLSSLAAVRIASPTAVPPPVCGTRASAALVSAWSLVGDWTTLGVQVNSSRPTCTAPGTFDRKRSDARCAARKRDGATSVACMELLTSSASITAPSVVGFATLRWGRAAATIRTAKASTNATIGRCRRHRGRRGATDSVKCGVTNAEAASARRRCRPTYQ